MAEISTTSFAGDANLQGYWRMEDNWNDSSTNGYNLTANNSPTFSTSKYGKGGSFTASSSQYSSMADASCANLEISGSQTFSCWVNITTLANFLCPMAKSRSDNTVNHSIVTDVSGVVYFTLTGLTTNHQVSSGATTLSTGTWYHLCGVYNSSNSTLKLYVNGVEAGSVTASGTATDTNGDFAIGRNGSNAALYFDGLVDDVAIFNRALSASEVLQLYEEQQQGYFYMSV